MKYNIQFFNKSDFEKLEKEWRCLEKGSDMTYFQRYEWYHMLISLNQKDTWAHEIVFCSVSDSSGKPLLIAPLWIVKRFFGKRDLKGVYVFGRRGWNDYCNYIYDTFCMEALEALFIEIRQKYHITRYVFENLKTDTALYNYLKEHYSIRNEKKQVCVAVTIPEREEQYLQQLSKHSKQNIRTACNRAITDGIEYVINEDDVNTTPREFQRYRELRVEEKNRITHGNLWHQIRNRLSVYVRYQFPRYTPMENDKHCHYLSCRTASNELMGAFCYGKDLYRREIVVMAVSLNMAYKRYSPCMLAAYQYIISHIADDEVRTVNFTRGNEKYKYVLGGKEHYCNSFELKYE